MYNKILFSEYELGNLIKRIFMISLCCAILSGCMYSPENKSWVNANDLDFYGYAEHRGATIEVQAFDQNLNIWTTVVTVTSSSNPTTIAGDTLYAWKIENFDFTQVPRWVCYWGHDGYCNINAGVAYLKLRFHEIGSSLGYLITFDEGHVAGCVADQLNAGNSLQIAGYICRSSEWPVLTLKMFT